MGMFNTVKIDCPHCGEETEEQSKGGSCSLKRTKLEDAEVSDIMSVSNWPRECYNCRGKYIVRAKVSVVTVVEKCDPNSDEF
jgi:DNA-directed RNA polymerase subunit RPC12/RpoP